MSLPMRCVVGAARLVRVRALPLCRASSSPPSSSPSTPAMQFAGRDVTAELLDKAGARDARMREAYDAMPAAFPAHAQPSGGAGAASAAAAAAAASSSPSSTADVGAREAFRKRLLYRSRQRGWLEVDLLLGAWADAHLAALPDVSLREYERVLNRETLDLFNLLTGKAPAPPELEGPVLDSIRRFVAEGGKRFVGPAGYASVKGAMSN